MSLSVRRVAVLARTANLRLAGASLQFFLWRRGSLWPLCAVLLAAATALWALVVAPMRQRLAAVNASIAFSPKPPALIPPTADPIADPRTQFPDSSTLGAQVRALAMYASQRQLTLPAAEYQFQRDPLAGMVRARMSFSLKTDYPRLRDFVEVILREMPNASLDRLSVRRESISQGQLDAQVSISLWAREALAQPRVVGGTQAVAR